MRAVLLGTGSPPPNPKRRGPATLLTLGEEMFLVDAGSGVGAQLVQAGVRPYDWPRVLITHHHSDHIIDLGHLLITRWISGQNAPFEVWGPAGTQRQMDKLLDYLDWDIEIRRHDMVKRARPIVRVTEIEEGKIFEVGGVTVSAFTVDHDPVRPAVGYRFEGGGRRVAVSGDTRPSENLIRWSRGVDCLIHECCEMTKTTWTPDCARVRRVEGRRGRIHKAAGDACASLPLGGRVLADVLHSEIEASQSAYEERRSRSAALDVDRVLGLDHEQGRDAVLLEIPRRAAPGRDGQTEQGRRDREQLEIAAEHRVRSPFGVEGDEGKRAAQKRAEVGLGEPRDHAGGKGGAQAPGHYLPRCALRKHSTCVSDSSCAATAARAGLTRGEYRPGLLCPPRFGMVRESCALSSSAPRDR